MNVRPILNPIYGMCDLLAAALLYLVFILVLLQVSLRYVFHMPLYWTEEFARFSLIYMVLIGSAAVIRDDGHPRLTMIYSWVDPKYKTAYEIALRIPSLLLASVFVFVGFPYAQINDWNSPALGISYYWTYLSIPIGGILLQIVLILDSFELISDQRRDVQASPIDEAIRSHHNDI